MAVLSLREEGRLDIDAPLAELAADLGALAQAGPDAPAVTVRQLLTMDAGLPQDDPWADRLMADDNARVSAELFARGATRSRAPGTAFEYSNYGWAVLGRVIEAVTGQRHQDVVRERVLGPLGLRSTVWSAGELAAAAGRDGLPPGRRRVHGRRCRWQTEATSPPSAASTAACATWRAGAGCSWARSHRATRPRMRPSAARCCARCRARAARSRPGSNGPRWPSHPASSPAAMATA